MSHQLVILTQEESQTFSGAFFSPQITLILQIFKDSKPIIQKIKIRLNPLNPFRPRAIFRHRFSANLSF
jgi:hypothetical protein